MYAFMQSNSCSSRIEKQRPNRMTPGFNGHVTAFIVSPFAGKRVIEQTIRQELPEGFQTAEFQLKHGFVDKIVKRKYLKMVLAKLLRLHGYKEV